MFVYENGKISWKNTPETAVCVWGVYLGAFSRFKSSLHL